MGKNGSGALQQVADSVDTSMIGARRRPRSPIPSEVSAVGVEGEVTDRRWAPRSGRTSVSRYCGRGACLCHE